MSLLNLFFPRAASVNVTNSICGVVTEHPSVADLREKAKAKMEGWGRKSLLEGGEFDRNNSILNGTKSAKKKTKARKK